MGKIKTRKAAAKRFKKTGRGNVMAHFAFGRHLLECKSRKRKRHYKRDKKISHADLRRIRVMLPNG